MIPVPVPPGRRGGIFNRMDGTLGQKVKLGRKLAREVEETIAANFGVLMPEYLRHLVPMRNKMRPRVRQVIDKFVEEMHANSDPWERRFAEKFGIVLAAALLLSEFGLTPWTAQRARNAITRVYRRSRAAFASVKEATDALIRRLQRLVRKRTRIRAIKKGKSLPVDQANSAWGYIWKLYRKRVVLIPLARMKRLVIPSAITTPVLRELADRQILLKSDDGKLTRQVMIKGLAGNHKPRYVCLVKAKVARPQCMRSEQFAAQAQLLTSPLSRECPSPYRNCSLLTARGLRFGPRNYSLLPWTPPDHSPADPRRHITKSGLFAAAQ